jgi:hypothetical protein
MTIVLTLCGIWSQSWTAYQAAGVHPAPLEKTAIGMNPFTALVNRMFPARTPTPESQSVNGVVVESATINPQDRIGDPLPGMTAYAVHVDYRGRMNRGEYTVPTWALFNAARAISAIGDKMSYWGDSLSGMDYDIRLSDIVKDKPELKPIAEKQVEALKAEYNRQNVPTLVRHLALAKFYGYSVLSKKQPMQPLDHWNILRDGLHGDFYWNPDAMVSSARVMPEDKKLDVNNFVIRTCEDSLLLVCLRAYVRIVDIEDWWDKNLEAESRRQVVVLTVKASGKDEADYKAAAKNIAAGRSGFIAQGDGANPTQVLFPPASRGLVFYNERLKGIDEALTKALTGSQLTMLTAPGSGTLAGNAHERTTSTILSAEAGKIGEVLQEQFDKPFLVAAGLCKPNESPYAYFALRTSKAEDPANEVAWTAQLASAGYRRDAVELSERVGMKLIQGGGMATQGTEGTQTAQPIPAQGAAETVAETALNGAQISSLVAILSDAASGVIHLESVKPIVKAAFPSIADATIESIVAPLRGFDPTVKPDSTGTIPNRTPAESLADAVGVPPEWLAPVRDLLDALEKKLTGGEVTTEQAQAEIQAVIDAMPELFGEMDTAALAATLAKTMLDAVKKQGDELENAFDPDQFRDENGMWAYTGPIETDKSKVQEKRNSIAEGMLTLRTGSFNGRKLSIPELFEVRMQVERDKSKIGESRMFNKPIAKVSSKQTSVPKFTITDVTPKGYGPGE